MSAAAWVYFARPKGIGSPVKIGCSRVPRDRLESLTVWSPTPLEFVAITPGTFTIERQLHGVFRQDHLHHEWFRWTVRPQRVIDSINDGTFDPSTLPPLDGQPPIARDRSFITPDWRYERSVMARFYRSPNRWRIQPHVDALRPFTVEREPVVEAGLAALGVKSRTISLSRAPNRDQSRVVLCSLCEHRVGSPQTRGCTAVDCPHVDRQINDQAESLAA